MGKHSAYEPAIDGLRAIAVIIVVLYHAGFETFRGGFVGVDVFFVISGFLITRLIVAELGGAEAAAKSGTRFDFLRFYERRVRRLFPALASTIVLSFLIALILFTPGQMDSLMLSASAAVLSVSNFFFWFTADYFDAAASTKPLLHTWSLSVEEQFYLVWPLLLTVTLRRFSPRGMVLLLLSLCIASLACAEWMLAFDRSSAYYMLPARVVELGMGALLVWLKRATSEPPPLALDLALGLGLGLIAYASVTLTEFSPFPGLNALMPCFGTVLALFSCSSSRLGGVLRWAPMVGIGKISYSLYLLHWPLIVFLTTYRFAPLAKTDQIVVVIVSILAAGLQYRLVEAPLRYPSAEGGGRRRVFTAFAAAVIAVGLATGVTLSTTGFAVRIPADRLQVDSDRQWSAITKQYCEKPDPRLPASLFTCQNDRGKPTEILIWGDSHAWHLAPGFASEWPDHNIHVLYRLGCVAQSGFAGFERRFDEPATTAACIAHNKSVLEYLEGASPTNIVLSGAKRGAPEDFAAATNTIVARLEARGHRVAVLSDIVRPGRHLADCTNVPAVLFSAEELAERCQADAAQAKRDLEYNAVLAERIPGIVRLERVQCPEGRCSFAEDGTLLFRDAHHLNVAGARFFVSAIREDLPF